MLSGAEVAQIGRAPDSTTGIVGGEAEDRAVASSSPALGTTMLTWNKLTTSAYLRFLNSLVSSMSQIYSNPASTSFFAVIIESY